MEEESQSLSEAIIFGADGAVADSFFPAAGGADSFFPAGGVGGAPLFAKGEGGILAAAAAAAEPDEPSERLRRC